MSLRRWLDAWVDSAAREKFWRVLDEPARRRFERHLSHLTLSPRAGRPVVNYGVTADPDAGGIVHGGRVKLRHLADEFPATAEDFNLLYLVSSAPPRFAPDLVRWIKAHGVKFVWNQNGVAYPAWYGTRSEELNAPMRALRGQADFIFYQSEFCRHCADRFLGPSEAPAEIAFNCVDMAQFRPGQRPATSPCQLLAAGSHHESYRVFSVLETVAELVRRRFPVELHLAGRLAWPGAEAAVTGKIRALGIARLVRRTPAYRQADAPAIYQAAHILLHPKYKDPCPTVPIEAMACGVPVVGSESGGMPELVAPEAGVLLKVPDSWEKNFWPDPTAMADAVEIIMRRQERYAAAARAHAAARFSATAWVAQHRRVFEALVAA